VGVKMGYLWIGLFMHVYHVGTVYEIYHCHRMVWCNPLDTVWMGLASMRHISDIGDTGTASWPALEIQITAVISM